MRVARALASEITTIGLRLYELLKKEEINQKARQDAINLLYNVSYLICGCLLLFSLRAFV